MEVYIYMKNKKTVTIAFFVLHQYVSVFICRIHFYLLGDGAECLCKTKQVFMLNVATFYSYATAVLKCREHGMTLLNLTNNANLTKDVNTLNNTLNSMSCNSLFWLTSGNQTALTANIGLLGALLSGILGGVLDLVGALLEGLGLCIIPLLCPATTTPAPITQAVMICTRSVQQRVIQKCPLASNQPNMRMF